MILNLSQEGFVGRILRICLLLCALLFWCLVQACQAGLMGHRWGKRLASRHSITADGAAGAPCWIGACLRPPLLQKSTILSHSTATPNNSFIVLLYMAASPEFHYLYGDTELLLLKKKQRDRCEELEGEMREILPLGVLGQKMGEGWALCSTSLCSLTFSYES